MRRTRDEARRSRLELLAAYAALSISLPGCFIASARLSAAPTIDDTGSAGFEARLEGLVGAGLLGASGIGVGLDVGGAWTERSGGLGGFSGGLVVGGFLIPRPIVVSGSVLLPAGRTEASAGGAGLGVGLNVGPTIVTGSAIIDVSLGARLVWIDQLGHVYVAFPLSLGLSYSSGYVGPSAEAVGRSLSD